MNVFDRVREKTSESKWTSSPYKGFVVETPSNTFGDIVTMAFDDVNNSYSHARHSRYDDMYKPYLGSFRERNMYTSLAPSLCIANSNRACSYQQTPHKALSTKRGEWLVERDRQHTVRLPRYPIQPQRASSQPPEPTHHRGTYTMPTSTTRVDNHFLYWKGRAGGLQYIAPFLQTPDHSVYENRRYQRIFWSPEFINLLPSCRHATHLMLSAY